MKLFEKNYIAHPGLAESFVKSVDDPRIGNAALHNGLSDRTGRGVHQGYLFVDKKPPGNVCQVNLPDVSEDLPGCKRDYPGEDHHGDGVVGRDDG